MVTKEEIKNLADLARIEITETEVEGLAKELDSILAYVGEVQKFSLEDSSTTERDRPSLRNVMRGDIVTNEPGTYKEKLLANAPEREGDYIKVKKIL